jgi:hypothetical protein
MLMAPSIIAAHPSDVPATVQKTDSVLPIANGASELNETYHNHAVNGGHTIADSQRASEQWLASSTMSRRYEDLRSGEDRA